ncbi:hypothetical protein, partial [Paenibacillus sp. FSL R7-269]|uniref:hypothetical protein n=1 Tax=Paenibacillus sp. FSL R7-269 TaxID=1226755 RepID=UPI001F21AAAA
MFFIDPCTPNNPTKWSFSFDDDSGNLQGPQKAKENRLPSRLNCDPQERHFEKSDHLVGLLCFNQNIGKGA